MMYLSRATLGGTPLSVKNFLRSRPTGVYQEHQQVWQFFAHDPGARRDFLFRRDGVGTTTCFYIVSKRIPQLQKDWWQVETKKYDPRLLPGQRLEFVLRANPVVTRRTPDGRHVRHDMIMDAKKQSNYQELSPDERPPMSQIIQQAGWEWLKKKKSHLGIETKPSEVVFEGYRIHQTTKRGQKGSIRFSTIDIRGVLTVTDKEKLRDALFQGVGPAKGFGCGLLLIRPVIN